MDIQPPLDLAYLHQVSQDDSDFEQELLAVFMADTQTHLAAAKDAVSVQDAETIRQEAHHIKGASANVGAKRVAGLAAELENQAKQGDLGTASMLLQQLETATKAVAQFAEQTIS